MTKFAAPVLRLILLILIAVPAVVLAQDDRANIDRAKIPAEASNSKAFVPVGWKIEEEVTGDLNGDSLPDLALKLVEDKPAQDSDGSASERQRALVIIFRKSSGGFVRAAVADRLLQCTRCGGAFYGVVESPANVKISKGVLTVDQDHGSRDLTNTIYHFRYDAESGNINLIGFDFSDTDRAIGGTVSESTNYLTGVRIVTRSKGKRDTKLTTQIPKSKISIEKVDSDKFEEDAGVRLKL